jgi:hypothetical protein
VCVFQGLQRRAPLIDPIEHQTVYTNQGTLVGQVVGDAAEITFSRGYVHFLLVCLAPADIAMMSMYTQPDLGRRVGQSSVTPLYLEVDVDASGRLCGLVPIPASGLTLVPIYRLTLEEVCSWQLCCCGCVCVCVCVCVFLLVLVLRLLVLHLPFLFPCCSASRCAASTLLRCGFHIVSVLFQQ